MFISVLMSHEYARCIYVGICQEIYTEWKYCIINNILVDEYPSKQTTKNDQNTTKNPSCTIITNTTNSVQCQINGNTIKMNGFVRCKHKLKDTNQILAQNGHNIPTYCKNGHNIPTNVLQKQSSGNTRFAKTAVDHAFNIEKYLCFLHFSPRKDGFWFNK